MLFPQDAVIGSIIQAIDILCAQHRKQNSKLRI